MENEKDNLENEEFSLKSEVEPGADSDKIADSGQEDEKLNQEKQKEEEVKKKIAAMMPDEFFKGPQKPEGCTSVSCFNCILATFVVVLVFSLLFMTFGLKFIRGKLISEDNLMDEKVLLSDEEKDDLEKKIEQYDQAVEKASQTGESTTLKWELTGPQINALLEKFDEMPGPDRSKLRIYPIEDIAEIRMSIPFNEHNFINVMLKGKPVVKNYKLKFDLETIQVGEMKDAEFFKDRVKRKLKREIEQTPEKMNLPFRVKSFKIEKSRALVELTILGRKVSTTR